MVQTQLKTPLHKPGFFVTLASVLMLLNIPKALADPTLPAAGDTDHPIPGVVQPYCPEQTQVFMNRCAARWRQLSESLHGEILHEVINQSLPQAVVQLIDAEMAWEGFRDSHCNLFSRQVEGGSLHPFVLDSCMARLTNERVAALQAWGKTDLSASEAEQQLQAMYQSLVSAMHPPHLPLGLQPGISQRLWETYRQEHCRFEAMSQLSEGLTTEAQLEAGCRARLAVERITQLSNLLDLGW
jgi:uncharacterized protein YecT (DUF1311 family)